jgi:O-antigen ligase
VNGPTMTLRRVPVISISSRSLLLLAGLLIFALLTVAAGRVSETAFKLAAAALIAFYAYAAFQAPRLVLLVLLFTPMLDRYIIGPLVPEDLRGVTSYLSEGLLLVASLVILYRGWRAGRLVAAFAHPAFALMLVFTGLAAISAVLNAVPPVIAIAGVVFTLDAAALFFLPRLIGFDVQQARAIAVTYVIVAVVAAVLALMQVYLKPDILGLGWLEGRFKEGVRVGAFLNGNPNMLGAVLAMAVPFPVYGLLRTDRLALRITLSIVSFVLVLALFFTFSRGAWLGLAVAMVIVSLFVDRRALIVMAVLVLAVYGSAQVVPRHLWATSSEASQFEIELGDAVTGSLSSVGGSGNSRSLFIQNALPIIRDHPIVGAGPGRYGGAVSALKGFESPLWKQYTDGKAPVGRTVDNFWLHILVEFGIAGTLALIGAFLMIGRELLRAGRNSIGVERVLQAAFLCAGIVIVIDSVSEMLLEGNTTSFVMWAFLGIGSALAMASSSVKVPAPKGATSAAVPSAVGGGDAVGAVEGPL